VSIPHQFNQIAADCSGIPIADAPLWLERPSHSHLTAMIGLVQLEDSPATGLPRFEDAESAGAWLDRVRAEQDRGTALTFYLIHPHHGMIGTVRLTGLQLPGFAPLSYWIAAPFRRRGYATAAVAAFLRRDALGFPLRRICAFVQDHNAASRKVLERSGFALRGNAFDDGAGPVWRYDFERVART
jgi:RimJ/RimL family protein N-acetyltransferase